MTEPLEYLLNEEISFEDLSSEDQEDLSDEEDIKNFEEFILNEFEIF